MKADRIATSREERTVPCFHGCPKMHAYYCGVFRVFSIPSPLQAKRYWLRSGWSHVLALLLLRCISQCNRPRMSRAVKGERGNPAPRACSSFDRETGINQVKSTDASKVLFHIIFPSWNMYPFIALKELSPNPNLISAFASVTERV